MSKGILQHLGKNAYHPVFANRAKFNCHRLKSLGWIIPLSNKVYLADNLSHGPIKSKIWPTISGQIHGTYYERTQCICGLWDGNRNNDFMDRDGNVVGSPTTMGNSWRVSNDDGCPNPPEPTDPCDLVSREEKNWAEQYCAKYKQEPFRSCPVDVTPSYKVKI